MFYGSTPHLFGGFHRSHAEDVIPERLNYDLNTDFEATLMSATEIQALVAAWQSGAISRDTLLHNFRTGEILPPARTNDQELELIRKEPPPPNITPMLQHGSPVLEN